MEDSSLVVDTKARITRLWDQAAAAYDQGWSHGLRTAAERRAWSALLARLLPSEPPLRVLDVGCGTGFLALLLAEAGHRVVGVDLSEPMLAVARREAAARGLRLELATADAEDPPPALGRFDAVVSRHLLWTLPHPDRAIRVWRERVTAGGRVLAVDGLWRAPARLVPRLATGAERIARRVLGKDAAPRGYDPEVAERLPLRDLAGPQPVRDLFVEAGLVEVGVEWLDALDRVERSAMPLRERLRRDGHRRYLVRGRRSG
ncbi:MAG TPA: methyltransferase domain-containing protein [Candidatus Dormibacteraeota bacterium]|nr:methyltransferase domain-containing protein [Candidatus Dormibacteraeota bacterium]